jgi:putative FmdB family regulatory protein
MPLYEYECDVCAHRFERIQKFSDPLVDVCPLCGGHVRKLLSSPAFQFKGTGWYVTDYAKKTNTDSNKGSDSKGDSKSDSKSADSSSSESSASSADASSASSASTATKTESKPKAESK